MRVAIVGGGLGGLAAALFLREAQIDATVHEQASELSDVGAPLSAHAYVPFFTNRPPTRTAPAARAML